MDRGMLRSGRGDFAERGPGDEGHFTESLSEPSYYSTGGIKVDKTDEGILDQIAELKDYDYWIVTTTPSRNEELAEGIVIFKSNYGKPDVEFDLVKNGRLRDLSVDREYIQSVIAEKLNSPLAKILTITTPPELGSEVTYSSSGHSVIPRSYMKDLKQLAKELGFDYVAHEEDDVKRGSRTIEVTFGSRDPEVRAVKIVVNESKTNRLLPISDLSSTVSLAVAARSLSADIASEVVQNPYDIQITPEQTETLAKIVDIARQYFTSGDPQVRIVAQGKAELALSIYGRSMTFELPIGDREEMTSAFTRAILNARQNRNT